MCIYWPVPGKGRAYRYGRSACTNNMQTHIPYSTVSTMSLKLLIHLFSFAFSQCSITIRRHIRQFVIEQNNSINFIRDWPMAIVQNTLDASSSMVIVNWTLCITFGIFKLFGQWAFYSVTFVRVWKAPWLTVWNECRIVLKICHFLRTMLKMCSMTNWNPISAIGYAHLPISLHELWEVCRVLLLRSNGFDDWPFSIAKGCIVFIYWYRACHYFTPIDWPFLLGMIIPMYISVQLKFVCHCLACFVENISNKLICGLSP